MSEEYKYTFPVDELDKIIEDMMNGIQPMISDEMQLEVQLRWKERNAEEFGTDDEEELDPEMMRVRAEVMKKKIEKDRKKATRTDALILTITDEQKQKIREEMEFSIVRPNPNDAYNIPNDELFQSVEKRRVYERLKGLKNCYYNQQDYVNAMAIIKDAIEMSLGKYGNGDYPWLSYQEAVKEFNAGRIKFNWCELPKLYINHSTIITDPEILKGVITGEIVLRDRRDDEKPKVKSKKYNPVALDYDVMGDAEYQQMVAAHKAGYDTPASTVIKHKSTTYNPASMPFSTNRFFASKAVDKDGTPMLFDWSKEGAGEEYFNLVKGRKQDSSDIVRFVNTQNDNMFNSVVSRNVSDFLRSMKSGSTQSGGYDYTLPNFAQPVQNQSQYNAEAAAIEQQLLASITMNNPTG